MRSHICKPQRTGGYILTPITLLIDTSAHRVG